MNDDLKDIVSIHLLVDEDGEITCGLERYLSEDIPQEIQEKILTMTSGIIAMVNCDPYHLYKMGTIAAYGAKLSEYDRAAAKEEALKQKTDLSSVIDFPGKIQ